MDPANSLLPVPHTTSPAPILRLPAELHLEIISLLDLRDSVGLSSTARYFRSIIPSPTHGEFLAAEESPWAKTKLLYTCKGCISFRSWERFADEMRKGKWCRSGTQAIARFCLKCGVDDALYAPGTHVTICNQPHVLCSICQKLSDHVSDRVGVCAGCSPGSRHRHVRSRNNSNDYIDYGDGWEHTMHRSSDRNHLQDHCTWPEE
jgi:hypothetical protein